MTACGEVESYREAGAKLPIWKRNNKKKKKQTDKTKQNNNKKKNSC